MTTDPIWFNPPPRSTSVPEAPARPGKARLAIEVDGAALEVEAGTTLLEACRAAGAEIPTICYLETLTPVNACRICVVEVEGARVLAPACSRRVEAGMKVKTQSERVRLSRKLVLELLGSSVDLSTAPGLADLMREYGAEPARFGEEAERVDSGVKIDNELYVRDYGKCVLCYKCVEACGHDAQNTFAITAAGRGFDAHISTEWNVPLPTSACVYCGNCIAVCPTGALMAKPEFDLRREGQWREEEQTKTDTICGFCGVGCTLTLHIQDEQIVKATSPIENGTTHGNLCVKGRFGFEFVQIGRQPKAG
jgi:predicted molibdopterin-dependent oxidoreductase YjgC